MRHSELVGTTSLVAIGDRTARAGGASVGSPSPPAPPLVNRKDRTISKYRKKPVVIEAFRVVLNTGEDPGGTIHAPTMNWLAQADPNGASDTWGWFPDHIDIDTLEGTMRAEVGDWIIRGVAGEFYPCKPDIFATTYEPADG